MRRTTLIAVLIISMLVGGVSFAASQAGEDSLLSQSWSTMQTASLYTRYEKQNPLESARLEAYWANGGTVPSITTAFGKALLLEAQAYWSLKGTPPPPPPGDTTPPTVTLTSPANGSTVSGTIAVSATAADNVAVTKVDFYRDGAVFATDTTSPYSVSFDTASVANGVHTFGPRAYDAAGNNMSGAAVAVTVANVTPPPPPTGEPAPIAGQGYHLAFDEQFDTFSPGTWETGIWYSPGAPANSITAANGILTLTSRRSQGYQNITVTTEAGTSPRVFTQGYFEARMKWTKGPGAWPAFWLLSYRHSVNPSYPSINPYCAQNGLPAAQCWSAELDVFEGQGTEPTVFYGTIHRNSCNCYGVSNSQNSNNYHNVGVDLTAAFHTYGMLWTASTISWYLDGSLVGSAPTYDSTNQPMFLLLQMWIGGWTSGTTSSTPDELKTEVDWVRAWQK